MWLAHVKSPRPHRQTLRMAMPCPSSERARGVTTADRSIWVHGFGITRVGRRGSWLQQMGSRRDDRGPFDRGTWNRHPKSRMMRPRTLYAGKPHTNPVITAEAYTIKCPESVKGGGGGCVLPFRLASGWRDRSMSCEERIVVLLIDEDPWPVPLGRSQGSSPQVSPIIAVIPDCSVVL